MFDVASVGEAQCITITLRSIVWLAKHIALTEHHISGFLFMRSRFCFVRFQNPKPITCVEHRQALLALLPSATLCRVALCKHVRNLGDAAVLDNKKLPECFEPAL